LSALAGRYTIERELGRGGMALVYLAHDLQEDRPVAIKVLRPELTAPIAAERFLREIQFASQLQHPNILPLYHSGKAEDLLYYVMPYVAGETLRQRLDREGQLAIPELLRFATEVADALSYAHGHGIIHRDIKPANILLSEGHALVADFGVARAVDAAAGDELTSSGLVIGTPQYMSPEQASSGARVDARSDIYALGCVVYEMLAGEPPFTGPTSQVVIARHMHEAPRSLRVVRATTPSHVEEAVGIALAKAPADRFQTAAAFAQALTGSTRTLPLRVRMVRARKPAATIVLAAAAALAVWAQVRPRTEALDSNKLVVFPLVERGGGTVRPGSGEEVALLIGRALEHSEPLKWIDGWTWLDSARRASVAGLDARSARGITRARRARFYVDGAVLGTADSSTVILRLNDTQGDSLVMQASSSGPAQAGVADLGLQAVSQLLPRLIEPGRRVDFTPLTQRRPAAIAHWLQGEREYRQSQFPRAIEYYRSAVEADSALAVAALKGGQAADWMGYDDDARKFVDVALAHERNLPPKYAHMAHGLRSYLSGRADSALARYRLALRIDSTWAEAWTGLGDVFYHLLPAESPFDSLSEAAFNDARRADPDFIPPVYHLAELALRRGDLRRSSALLADFSRSGPDSTWILQLELMASCRARGPTGVDWAAEAVKHSEEVFYAAKGLAAPGGPWGCSEAALRALLGSDSMPANYRRASLLILQSLLVAQGRHREASGLIDSAVARGLSGAEGLYVLDAVAGAPFEEQARTALDGLQGGTRTLEGPRLWFRGSWYAHTRDVPRLAAVVNELTERARRSADPQDRLLADAMTARLQLVRGDTAAATHRLLNLRAEAPRTYLTWGLWQPLAAERLALAEVLLAGGDPVRAIDVASGFDHHEPIVYVVYWPASLALRYRAALRLGRASLAERYAAQLRGIGREDLLESARAAEQPQPRSQP
jgi:tetratricopeptide (TPR) repeat protein